MTIEKIGYAIGALSFIEQGRKLYRLEGSFQEKVIRLTKTFLSATILGTAGYYIVANKNMGRLIDAKITHNVPKKIIPVIGAAVGAELGAAIINKTTVLATPFRLLSWIYR